MGRAKTTRPAARVCVRCGCTDKKPCVVALLVNDAAGRQTELRSSACFWPSPTGVTCSTCVAVAAPKVIDYEWLLKRPI